MGLKEVFHTIDGKFTAAILGGKYLSRREIRDPESILADNAHGIILIEEIKSDPIPSGSVTVYQKDGGRKQFGGSSPVITKRVIYMK